MSSNQKCRVLEEEIRGRKIEEDRLRTCRLKAFHVARKIRGRLINVCGGDINRRGGSIDERLLITRLTARRLRATAFMVTGWRVLRLRQAGDAALANG